MIEKDLQSLLTVFGELKQRVIAKGHYSLSTSDCVKYYRMNNLNIHRFQVTFGDFLITEK